MDKQLKKKVEQKLIHSMESILSGFNVSASEKTRKKIKEACKMVAKKFLKAIESKKALQNGKATQAKAKQFVKKKYVMPKRDKNGKFLKKKK